MVKGWPFSPADQSATFGSKHLAGRAQILPNARVCRPNCDALFLHRPGYAKQRTICPAITRGFGIE